MIDLQAIRKRWWLDDMYGYSHLLWGVDDVKNLISEVERLQQELIDLRRRNALSTPNPDRDNAEGCSLNISKTS